MLCGAIAYLMEFDTLIHLLVKTLACRAVRWVKGCIVAICASSSSYLSVSVRAGEAGIKHNLLQAFAIFPLEIADKGIISFPVRESVFFKLF